VPDGLDEIMRRLDTLENRLNSGSGLRAMMDLDQASLTMRLDAQDNLLRALSITQSDHTSRLTRLEDGQRRLEESQRRLEDAVGRVEAGIQAILALLRDRR
jgi:chromosome segregation ATPase